MAMAENSVQKFRHLSWIVLIFNNLLAYSQSGQDIHPYGSAQIRDSIQMAMISGDSALIWQKIRAGFRARGKFLGSPSQDALYQKRDSNQIQIAELEKAWDLACTHLAAWHEECPELSTGTPAGMLGAYLAEKAGKNKIPLEHLGDIAQMLEEEQFTYERAGKIDGVAEGAFGYANLPNNEPCAHSGSVQRATLTMCREVPVNCPVYKSGNFKDMKFAIADQSAEYKFWDGGMANHQGWAVEEMIQSYIHQKDSTLKAKLFRSALLGGSWCLAEIPVPNHSYTAKNIWALACLYDLTGDLKWKLQMLKLLKINLLPGILMDQNRDGMVDGAEPFRFDSLATMASIPGRMWDGHNSSSWNTAICAWALINSYASLRDRGNTNEAQLLIPYFESVLFNLSNEVIRFGSIPNGPGFRDLAYALLEGLIKVDNAENTRHPNWEKAANILWNAGVIQSGNLFTVNLGQYLLWKSGWKYQPRFRSK